MLYGPSLLLDNFVLQQMIPISVINYRNPQAFRQSYILPPLCIANICLKIYLHCVVLSFGNVF
jgi:hypothetical protein